MQNVIAKSDTHFNPVLILKAMSCRNLMLQLPGWQPVEGDPRGESGFEAVSANMNLASLEGRMTKKARHPNESEQSASLALISPRQSCSQKGM